MSLKRLSYKIVTWLEYSMLFSKNWSLSGIVSIILIDPLCRDRNARYTMVLFKQWNVKNMEDAVLFLTQKKHSDITT